MASLTFADQTPGTTSVAQQEKTPDFIRLNVLPTSICCLSMIGQWYVSICKFW
jgi:hypothetical protein